MAFDPNEDWRKCHNQACQQLYLPSMVHIDPEWPHSPNEVCPFCGRNLKESARQFKGVYEYGESEEEF
jgi:hypothetical protein